MYLSWLLEMFSMWKKNLLSILYGYEKYYIIATGRFTFKYIDTIYIVMSMVNNYFKYLGHYSLSF